MRDRATHLSSPATEQHRKRSKFPTSSPSFSLDFYPAKKTPSFAKDEPQFFLHHARSVRFHTSTSASDKYSSNFNFITRISKWYQIPWTIPLGHLVMNCLKNRWVQEPGGKKNSNCTSFPGHRNPFTLHRKLCVCHKTRWYWTLHFLRVRFWYKCCQKVTPTVICDD